jgi:hypothetical protein
MYGMAGNFFCNSPGHPVHACLGRHVRLPVLIKNPYVPSLRYVWVFYQAGIPYMPDKVRHVRDGRFIKKKRRFQHIA